MADEGLAFQYIIVAMGMTFFAYFAYGYFMDRKQISGVFKALALKGVPTVSNPLFYPRLTLLVPLYHSLSIRIFKRFWINHGFKAIFMFAFLLYARNVWNESLAEDPFTIVGVSTSATAAAVRRACRQGALKLHPDKHPGQEDVMRPQFERHARACKVLNNKELRKKYEKWGALPKADKGTGGEEAAATPTLLKIGGGGGFLSMMIYFLVFVGLPSTVLYHVGDFISDDDAKLAKIASDAKTLNQNLKDLYHYGRFGDLFLDPCELYISTALAELVDNRAMAKELNARGSSVLNSLLEKHQGRYELWLAREKTSKKDDEKAAAVKKIDAQIDQAAGAIDNVTKKSRSGRQ